MIGLPQAGKTSLHLHAEAGRNAFKPMDAGHLFNQVLLDLEIKSE